MWCGILMFLIGVLLCARGDERQYGLPRQFPIRLPRGDERDWIAVVRSRGRMEIVI